MGTLEFSFWVLRALQSRIHWAAVQRVTAGLLPLVDLGTNGVES